MEDCWHACFYKVHPSTGLRPWPNPLLRLFHNCTISLIIQFHPSSPPWRKFLSPPLKVGQHTCPLAYSLSLTALLPERIFYHLRKDSSTKLTLLPTGSAFTALLPTYFVSQYERIEVCTMSTMCAIKHKW